jgi:hypothetical protein
VRSATVSHFGRRSPAGTPHAARSALWPCLPPRHPRTAPRSPQACIPAPRHADCSAPRVPVRPCARAPFPLVAGRSLRRSQAAARCLLRCRCSLLAAAACFHADEWTRTTQPAGHAPICCLLASTRTSGRGRRSQSATRPSAAARDGSWTHGYGYPRVSYPPDMDTGTKTHPWVLSGRIPEIHRVGSG